MAYFKRFFLFTIIRAIMRLFWQGQEIRERTREIEHLERELRHSQDGAGILVRAIREEYQPIRAKLETGHAETVRGLLEQLRIGAEARMILAREIVAKNGEIETLERENAKLREAAMTDSLTGLYNRHGASVALGRLLSVFERQNHAVVEAGSQAEVHDLSVLVFDLNNFKEVNDRFGHAAGDEVLVRIAAYITQAFRAEDVLERPGGDEFRAYLINASREGAIKRAEKLSALMLADEQLQFDDLRVTVSIGISHGRFATKRGGLQIVDTLEKLADAAMYAAKEESRTASGIVIAPDAVASDTLLGNL